MTFNKKARERHLSFATSLEARWPGNLRDLAASVTRTAIFSRKGRIDLSHVERKIERLERLWAGN